MPEENREVQSLNNRLTAGWFNQAIASVWGGVITAEEARQQFQEALNQIEQAAPPRYIVPSAIIATSGESATGVSVSPCDCAFCRGAYGPQFQQQELDATQHRNGLRFVEHPSIKRRVRCQWCKSFENVDADNPDGPCCERCA